jgi:hypothetical protein
VREIPLVATMFGLLKLSSMIEPCLRQRDRKVKAYLHPPGRSRRAPTAVGIPSILPQLEVNHLNRPQRSARRRTTICGISRHLRHLRFCHPVSRVA